MHSDVVGKSVTDGGSWVDSKLQASGCGAALLYCAAALPLAWDKPSF